MTAEFLINHLWQSSFFTLFAGLLAFVLRRSPPKIRYWVWLSASLKFLVPLTLLMSLGSMFSRPTPRIAAAATVVVRIAEPFTQTSYSSAPASTAANWVPAMIGITWFLGFLAIASARYRGWRQIQTTLRSATPVELPIPIPAVVVPGAAEPGIIGFLRPVLVLPVGLVDHLNANQLNAVLTHEMCHVRRRDNLFAAIHMAVETIFWFHPLVWWIGSRMLDERERACDEEVLRMGCEPADYVTGILEVCRLYSQSQLPCVSGVTGADVKKRLRAILAGDIAREWNTGKKAALAALGLAMLAAPIVIGVWNSPAIRAQNMARPKFEVASIKPCQEPLNDLGIHSSPGRLASDCTELLNLIGNAYNLFGDGHLNHNSEPAPISGGPSWIHSAAYEINARAEGTPGVPMMMGPMMQMLLEDRFQLKIHRQTTEGPVYFLTVARGGAKLHPFTEGDCTPYSTLPRPPLQPGSKEYCESVIYGGPSPAVEAKGARLGEFTRTLRHLVDRPVIDKTGITGRFNIRVEFSGEDDPGRPPLIYTAIQEQLGLKLESGRGPVETLVIDHIARPSGN